VFDPVDTVSIESAVGDSTSRLLRDDRHLLSLLSWLLIFFVTKYLYRKSACFRNRPYDPIRPITGRHSLFLFSHTRTTVN
jgi:hypothetical protein